MSRIAIAGAVILFGCGVLAESAHAQQQSLSTVVDTIVSESNVRDGLVVHVGCGEGRLAAALATRGRFLVHGLDRDWQRVMSGRSQLYAAGKYGTVSLAHWHDKDLPYTDNLVSLLVVTTADAPTRAETMRVLQPGGVAMIQRAGKWERVVKPRPRALDEWTHFLHDASNNAVSHDRAVGPPTQFQWTAGPRWGRSHDFLASLSAMVTADGRVFYIVDEGSIAHVAMPPRWMLVARNAFNGVVLWKRPIEHWEGHLRGFRSGPPEIGRRLVAIGDKVYVTLGYGAAISELDAATGKTLTQYPESANTLEFVVDRGTIFSVIGDCVPQNTDGHARPQDPKNIWHWWVIRPQTVPKKHLVAIDAKTGKSLWNSHDEVTANIYPTALAVDEQRVVFQSDQGIVVLERTTGREVWHAARPAPKQRFAWSTPTLVIADGVLLSADRAAQTQLPGTDEETATSRWVVNSQGGIAPIGEMRAYDVATGKPLWQAPCREGYNSPVDVLVVNGRVWSGNLVVARDPGITVVRDLHTGEVCQQRPRDQQQISIRMSHHRCYRNKATDNYVLLGRDGIEFIDTVSGKAIEDRWVRGTCQYGIMPANGMVYVPPHSCACHIESKLDSFTVLASSSVPARIDDSQRLQQGPAYATIKIESAAQDRDQAWPTYRGDARRSGVATTGLQRELKPCWDIRIPDARLSSMVAAGDTVVVADIDRHAVLACDTATGKRRWTFVAGGRVDSPPTLVGNAVLFGCADGSIYCLHAESGDLAWRFLAAPADRRIVSYGQLESAWPLHGSILVKDGVAMAVAGRTPELAHGLTLVRLQADTGKLLSTTSIDGPALPDVLSCDASSVYMRHRRFDLNGVAQSTLVPHLYSPAGFLDDTWWHRTYWMFGTNMRSGWGAWPMSGNQFPSGRILTVDGKTVYGFGRLNQYHRNGSHVGMGTTRYVLYAAPVAAKVSTPKGARSRVNLYERGIVRTQWQEPLPIIVRAMLKSADQLYVAGPPDVLQYKNPANVYPYRLTSTAALQAQEAALNGDQGGILKVMGAADGKETASYQLSAPPVWDGMVAANGRLFMALKDGHIICLAAKKSKSLTSATP